MGEIYNIVIEDTITASTGVEFVEKVESGGTLLSAILHWPGGCSGLLGIALFHFTDPILPRKGTSIALDNTTQLFPINRKVNAGDELLLKVENADSPPNDHRFSATIFIEVAK
jgi:hypothetical protein